MKYLFVILAVLLVNTEGKVVSTNCSPNTTVKIDISIIINILTGCRNACLELCNNETETPPSCDVMNMEQMIVNVKELGNSCNGIMQLLESIVKLLYNIIYYLLYGINLLGSTVQSIEHSLGYILEYLVNFIVYIVTYIVEHLICTPQLSKLICILIDLRNQLDSLICALIKAVKFLIEEIDELLEYLLSSTKSGTQLLQISDIEKITGEIQKEASSTMDIVGSLEDIIQSVVHIAIEIISTTISGDDDGDCKTTAEETETTAEETETTAEETEKTTETTEKTTETTEKTTETTEKTTTTTEKNCKKGKGCGLINIKAMVG